MTNTKESVSQDPAFEHVFEEVPKDKRKNLPELSIVLAGFPIALSNFVIGGIVGSGLTFQQAILALITGNLILIGVVIFMGMFASRVGLSSTLLSRRAFGKAGSYIFSGLLILSALTWISLNGDIFARLINSVFSWWPLPISLTAALVVFMWLLSAMKGFKGLAIISKVGVPAAILLSLIGVIAIGQSEGGYESVFSYVPENPITFTAATATIIGGWIYGATITADLTRFAKKSSHVVIAGSFAFIIGCLGFQFTGALVAISTGESDFIEAMVSLGIGLVAFFTAVFCLWTTEDKDIYTGSLAMQNIIKDTTFYGKIKHKHSATFIAFIAALFAAGGIFTYIEPIVQFLSVLIPPVAGIIIAEGFIIKNTKHDQKINTKAIVAWMIGAVLSYLALATNFFISPLIGIITAALFYILFEKNHKNH